MRAQQAVAGYRYAWAVVVLVLLAVGSRPDPALARAALHPTVTQIGLPGSMSYEPAAVQPGPSGSVWVVGSHNVWRVSSAGSLLDTMQPPAGLGLWSETATVTGDGGVSFVGRPELSGSGGPVLEHVSPSGSWSTVALNSSLFPSGPMVLGGAGLVGVWWTGIPLQGEMLSLNPVSGAVSGYALPLAPFSINNAPGGRFWVGGVTKTMPEHYRVSLVSASGVIVKTINLPGKVSEAHDILSAAAPGQGMWLAVSGYATHISGNGAVTSYRLPFGTCGAPYGIASAPDGTAWLLTVWPGIDQCHGVRRFPMQLTRLSKGRLASASLTLPGFFTAFPAMTMFAGGKLWVISGSMVGVSTALYVVGVR